MMKKLIICLLFVNIFFIGFVENRSSFSIGDRVHGDQLLVKDVLVARSPGLDQSPQTTFNYDVPESITNVEILSEENVTADLSFSFVNDLVEGTVKATRPNAPPFEVLIRIFGFNETVKNVDPRLVLDRAEGYKGALEPVPVDEEYDEEDHENEYDEQENNFSGEEYVDLTDSELAENDIPLKFFADSQNEYEDKDFEPKDKFIEIGQRQEGDILLHHSYQSTSDTKHRSNHSLTFYYIDSNYITFVQFVLFEHFADKSLTSPHYKAPLAEYSHYSANSLKAKITDFNTTFLFVEVFIYGYQPKHLPKYYKPFMSPSTRKCQLDAKNMPASGTDAHLTPLQRIKHLLNDCDPQLEAKEWTLPESMSTPAAVESNASPLQIYSKEVSWIFIVLILLY